MLKKYIMIVRDEIRMPSPRNDEILETFGCYYKSPVFLADGSLASFDREIDKLYERFRHFLKWTAEIIEVE
jgi:hypothetical protein